jgi:Ca2+-binding EF-hand superfamily protein
MVPIMDMNDDTYAHTHSLKQVSEYERIFEVLAAGQGSIPADSMGRLMRKMGIHCSRDELRELRDLVDQDGYGQVHMEDFVRLMTKKVYEDFQEEDMQVIDNAFKM